MRRSDSFRLSAISFGDKAPHTSRLYIRCCGLHIDCLGALVVNIMSNFCADFTGVFTLHWCRHFKRLTHHYLTFKEHIHTHARGLLLLHANLLYFLDNCVFMCFVLRPTKERKKTTFEFAHPTLAPPCMHERKSTHNCP